MDRTTVSDVIVVGPKTISGRGAVASEVATIALEAIDDDLALVDDRVVSVDELWCEVLGSASGGSGGHLVLICPSWWASSRITRIGAAGRRWNDDVVVHRRTELLGDASTVVELGPDLVVVHADGRRHLIPRTNEPPGIVAAIVERLRESAAVTVDVPSGIGLLGTDLARALRVCGIEVTLSDDRALVDALAVDAVRGVTRWRPTPRMAAVSAAILVAGGLAAAGVGIDGRTPEPIEGTWLVEGRVALEVPAGWTVERITAGPGSARVQVVSPTDRSQAIHVTQSRMPPAQTLDSAADSLRSALAEQPDGIFVDFAVDRAAITYREVRADRRIDWTVSIDGGVRIAVGCQDAAQRPGRRRWCGRAVESAHAVGRN